MLRLYKFVEANLPAGVYDKITYDVMNEDEKGTVGIFNYGSSDSEYSLSGRSFDNIKMQVQVVRRDGEAGLQEVYDFLREFIDNIEKVKYKVDGLSVLMARHARFDANFVKISDYNTSLYEAVIDIKFKLL